MSDRATEYLVAGIWFVLGVGWLVWLVLEMFSGLVTVPAPRRFNSLLVLQWLTWLRDAAFEFFRSRGLW